jgi:hypothetical protein
MDIKEVLSGLTRGSDKIVATRKRWHDGDYIYLSGAGAIHNDAGDVAVLSAGDILADDWYNCERGKTFVSEDVYRYVLWMKEQFGVDTICWEKGYLYFTKCEDDENSIIIPLAMLKQETRDDIRRLNEYDYYDIDHLIPFESGK